MEVNTTVFAMLSAIVTWVLLLPQPYVVYS